MEFEMNNKKWEIEEADQEFLHKLYNEEYVEDGDYYLGSTVPTKNKVYIYKELDMEQKKKTLMHELMHCYLFSFVSFNPVNFSIDDFCDLSANSHDIIHKIVEDYFK